MTETYHIPKIVEEALVPGVLRAIMYANTIIEINWDHSIDVIEEVHLKIARDTIEKLGKGKPMPVYLEAKAFLEISKEGRKYAASEDGSLYTLANAVLLDNLAKKILFNFFVKVNQPLTPIRGFATKEGAFKWLEQLLLEKDKSNNKKLYS